MGRMKELCIQIMSANDGVIPREMTITDVRRMDELQIFQWEEYEREQEKRRLQHLKSKDSGEIGKEKQVAKKFSSHYGKAKENKGGEQ
jgi:hypothetical protein